MKPRNRIEKEVARLSRRMPHVTDVQKEWMTKQASYSNAHRYQGRMTDIECFIIVTVKDGWQVLRHFYMYASYKRKKLDAVDVAEVMQQWFKNGRYVFLSRDRCGQGACNDAWCLGRPMSIRRGEIGGYVLVDPRQLGYTAVKYEVRQQKYRYVPKDKESRERIDILYRALNTSPFNETLFKQYPDTWEWSKKNDFLFDKEKTAALKIAIRYNYNYKSIEWRDLVENLVYLGKDTHNPSLVCPKRLKEAHEYWSQAAARKRKKTQENMAKLRQLAEERRELRRLELRAQWEEQQKERSKSAIPYYTKMRKKFFGMVIAENDIEIKVLQSVQEFMEEGKEMCHCVFANGYYDVKRKPNCLILSAKVGGERCETIEVDLQDYRVVQSRGKHNSNTPYHSQILDLMNRNMNQIRNYNIRKS